MVATKNQSSSGDTSKSKPRYTLRSASKAKDDKTIVEEISTASVPKRGKTSSNISKSVTVFNISGKDKSIKPPRRLSIPAEPAGTVTPPIHESRRPLRSSNGQGKSQTPVSKPSKSLNQKKFNILSSASYWLSQIKLSESAAKHSISLGFFKLALEAGCEPLQLMRDKFKSYVRRYNLGELEEFVKELLGSYDIPEDFEQLKVSVTHSQVPKEGAQASDDGEQSSVSSTGAQKLRHKSLNPENVQAAKVEEPKRNSTLKLTRASRNRGSLNKKSPNVTSVTHVTSGTVQKKNTQRPSRQASNQQKKKIKDQAKKTASGKDVADPLHVEGESQIDKENMMEEIRLTEEDSTKHLDQ